MASVAAEVRAILLESNQNEIVTKLDSCKGWSDEFCNQVLKLNANYPGGLSAYTRNARALLAASNSGANPLADVEQVEVPDGVNLDYGSHVFDQYENIGMGEIPYLCFVLVAGGLGERLGYSNIKLSLPIDLASYETYLGTYCASILALGNRCGVAIPLVIMTSDDTHARTEQLIQTHNNFGMAMNQIRLIKQEKVAALVNSEAGMLLDDSGLLLTKPHGHGDVHLLLHQTGIAQEWARQGKKWICFFQDTNGLVFKTMLAVVGVSVLKKFDLNSMCIPRLAKQEIGGITTLKFKDGKTITANTEYNQLGPLLKAMGGEGDVADSSGYSPYPGNINQLVASVDSYVRTLGETRGVMEEFVNPKYTDASKTAFKKPTRLECMMQDYAKVLPASANVGFTTSATWIGYAPAKNSISEGIAKIKAGCEPMCAATAETSMYEVNSEMWRQLGCQVAAPISREFQGIPVKMGPLISISPHFALTRKELSEKLPSPSSVQISQRSSLVILGSADVVIESLNLDGALVIDTTSCLGAGVRVLVKDLVVKNKGWELEPLSASSSQEEVLSIRGYQLVKHATEQVTIPSSSEASFILSTVDGKLVVEHKALDKCCCLF